MQRDNGTSCFLRKHVGQRMAWAKQISCDTFSTEFIQNTLTPCPCLGGCREKNFPKGTYTHLHMSVTTLSSVVFLFCVCSVALLFLSEVRPGLGKQVCALCACFACAWGFIFFRILVLFVFQSHTPSHALLLDIDDDEREPVLEERLLFFLLSLRGGSALASKEAERMPTKSTTGLR